MEEVERTQGVVTFNKQKHDFKRRSCVHLFSVTVCSEVPTFHSYGEMVNVEQKGHVHQVNTVFVVCVCANRRRR